MRENITVFQTTRFLGDFLLSLALIKQCVENGFETTLIMHSNFQEIGNLLPVRMVPVLKPGGRAGIKEVRDVISKIKPGAGLLAHRSLRSAITAAAAGLNPRIGFADSNARALYTHKVKRPEGIHESQAFKNLIKPLGIQAETGPEMWFPWKEQAEQSARKLRLPSHYAVIAPGASWVVKQWPVENFAQVGRWLEKQGITPVITGGPKDVFLGRKLAEMLGHSINLSGKTRVLEFMGVIAGAKLVVSGDSAPMHAAGCFNIPTVAIYGPTTKEMGFWPLSEKSEIVQIDVDCRPCSARGPRPCPKGHHRCMRELGPELVIDAINRVMR